LRPGRRSERDGAGHGGPKDKTASMNPRQQLRPRMTCLDPCGRSERSPLMDGGRHARRAYPSDQEAVWSKYGRDVVRTHLPRQTIQKIWDGAGLTAKAQCRVSGQEPVPASAAPALKDQTRLTGDFSETSPMSWLSSNKKARVAPGLVSCCCCGDLSRCRT
jgi:hypothetical protein